MSLPVFTKNEKIVFIVVIITGILLGTSLAGYIWIKTQKIVNSKSESKDTKTYLSTVTTQPTLFNHEWKRFHSKKYNLSFLYPSWINVGQYFPPAWHKPVAEDSGWILQDNFGKLSAEITISQLTLEDIKNHYPKFIFREYTQGKISWVKAVFDKKNTFYLLNRSNDNIWIISYLENWSVEASKASDLMNKVVQSVTSN